MKILILSPHIDDAELCMGGFISQHAADCHIAFYSDCDIPTAKTEVEHSMKILGVKHFHIKDHKRRYMQQEQQLILQDLINLKNGYDLVFAPHPEDIHQDHRAVSEAAIRAFGRKNNLYFYIWPPNLAQIPAKVFFELTEDQLARKVDAIMSYKSQVRLRPEVFNENFIRSQAVILGALRSIPYAEAFDIYRINMTP